MTDIEILTYHI